MLRPPRVMLAALSTTTAVVTAALCWFGWQLVEKQREIDRQQAAVDLDRRADAIAAAIRIRLADAGDRLSAWLTNPASPPPAIERAVVLAIEPGGIRVTPAGGLPYVPALPEEARADAFAHAEALEFAEANLTAAVRAYRALTESTDHATRAGAWFRLGRVLRKNGEARAAIEAYAHLEKMTDARVDDLPGDFAALLGRRAALAESGAGDAARELSTAVIAVGIDAGRWLLERRAAEAYRDQMSTAPRPPSWQLAAACDDAVRASSPEWPPRGQATFTRGPSPIIVVWRAAAERTVLLATFAHDFLAPAIADHAWRLVDADNRTLAGQPSVAGSVTRLIAAEYPWTLAVWTDSPTSQTDRSQPILVMLATVLIFVWGTAYFMARAIRREAQVSRQQSDFVAAVSHEFRSPLTTIRQLAELLESNRLLNDERRVKYYTVIAGEAARLHRLVETLLNFGRIEAGATRYRRDVVDLGGIVGDVIQEMTPTARDAGMRIDTAGPDTGLFTRGDVDALRIALRNLVDNAIKYSPGEPSIRVEWSSAGAGLCIRVIDSGPGIPAAERRTIFTRFVRGAAAMKANVRGTGVGLSMVREIVIAHGGDIALEDAPGRGSVFAIRLPLVEPPASSARATA